MNNFEDFWQASLLDERNFLSFLQGFNNYDADNKQLYLEYPPKAIALPKSKTKLGQIAKMRCSMREFSNDPMTLGELSRVLSSVYAMNGLEHRTYASAGATYSTELFAVCWQIESYAGKILYYDAKNHGVVAVGVAPEYASIAKYINTEIKGQPSVLLLPVMFVERVAAKYGERGGRFALLEAGAVMQQLSLAVAEDKKLRGVILGGLIDDFWVQQLDFNNNEVKIPFGYLIGKQVK